jgi:hypothetical protein
MKHLSQYMDNGKVAEVWYEKTEGKERFVVKILGEQDQDFTTEFDAEQYAEAYVQGELKEPVIKPHQVEMDFPDVELDYSLVQDPGVVKLKPVTKGKKINKE